MKVCYVPVAAVSSHYQFIGLLGSFQYKAVHLTTYSLKRKEKKHLGTIVFHCILILPVINMPSYVFLKQCSLQHFIWTSSPFTAVLAGALFVCFCIRVFFFSHEIDAFFRPAKLYTTPIIISSCYFLRPLLTAPQCCSHIEVNVFSVVLHTVVDCFRLYVSIICICTSVSLRRIPLVCLLK